MTHAGPRPSAHPLAPSGRRYPQPQGTEACSLASNQQRLVQVRAGGGHWHCHKAFAEWVEDGSMAAVAAHMAQALKTAPRLLAELSAEPP